LFVRLVLDFDFFADAFLTGAFRDGFGFDMVTRTRFCGGAFFRLPGSSRPPPYRRR
jgi:hypothetical protein